MEEQFYTIILRHDTSTNWMINNPVLAFGEYGVEDDTHKVKRGDGVTDWEHLTYDTFGISIESLDSDKVNYDNSISGLSATNVKDAIDELKQIIDNL